MQSTDRSRSPVERRAFWERPSFPRISEIGAALRHYREHKTFAEPGSETRRR